MKIAMFATVVPAVYGVFYIGWRTGWYRIDSLREQRMNDQLLLQLSRDLARTQSQNRYEGERSGSDSERVAADSIRKL